MKKSVLLLLVLAVMLTVILSGCTSPKANEPNEIVIGYNADQSVSSVAAFGKLGLMGFQIAVDEINAAGGILGKQIRPVILDDKGDKNISKQNMEQLIFEDNAIAIIGPANSANALYWLDLAQENEVIVISPIATATEITTMYKDRPRNYIFGIRVLDKDQVRLFVAYGIKESNNGDFAIIYDSTPYGTQGIKDVTDVLASWGKTPVYTKSFDKGTPVENLTNVISSAKDAGADVIVFYALADSNANLLKALDQVEDYNPIMLGTASNSLGLWQLAGPLASKLIFTAPLGADYNENSKVLNQKVIDKYGTAPILLSSAASGYDAVYLIKASIENAGTVNRVAVRDAMENIDSFPGTMHVFEKPFTKQDHEFLTVRDSFLSNWVDGKIVMLDVDVENLEIR